MLKVSPREFDHSVWCALTTRGWLGTKGRPGRQPAAARDPTCAEILCTRPLVYYKFFVGGRRLTSQRCPHTNPQKPWMSQSRWQRRIKFVYQLALRLSCLIPVDPVLSLWSLKVEEGIQREMTREWAAWEGLKQAWLALNVEGGVCEPRNTVASRSWKRQGNGLSPEPPEGMHSCQHLGFRPIRLVLKFWPPEL